MKNTVKAGLYAAAGTALIAANSVQANMFGQDKVQDNISGTANGEGVDTSIQDLIGGFMAFLALVAVIYLLWGGFNILTAGGDDDKVSKGKTVIIQAALGLIVIFLANSIVQWLVGVLFAS